MKLVWTQRAKEDLQSIGRFIARDNPEAARIWLGKLRASALGAMEQPKIGRIVPELGREDIRERIVGNYRIVYRVRARTIEVLTVFEGHRALRLEER